MKINLIVVGRIKDKNLDSLIKEYIKRLSAYCQLNIIELNDEPIKEKPNEFDINKAKQLEGEKILKKIDSSYHAVGFDLINKQPTSIEFAKILDEKLAKYGNKLCFVIGGSYGLSQDVKNRLDDSIGLSNLTFTHQMCRLIVLEQIYRAFKINHNEVYHK